MGAIICWDFLKASTVLFDLLHLQNFRFSREGGNYSLVSGLTKTESDACLFELKQIDKT